MVSQAGPVQWTGRRAVMTLPEQIDVSNAGQIREALLSVINRGATSLIADMSATISCDYAGADAVARAFQRAALAGAELRLVVTAQIVRRVLSACGLDRLVAIYPSLESAAAARAPAAAPARPGGPGGDGRAAPENRESRDASTALAPAVLRQMVDAFQDGVALADDHGTIRLANKRLEEMFGYQHDDLPGRPVEVLSLSPVLDAAGQFTLAVIRDLTRARPLDSPAPPARAAVTAGQEDDGQELLDWITSKVSRAGLSLHAVAAGSAGVASQDIAEALDHLDEVIRGIRDAAFTGRSRSTDDD